MSAYFGADLGNVADGVLAEGLGPEAIAVAAFDLALEGDGAAGGDFFADGAEVGSEFFVTVNAEVWAGQGDWRARR